jgi:hypothetical protein
MCVCVCCQRREPRGFNRVNSAESDGLLCNFVYIRLVSHEHLFFLLCVLFNGVPLAAVSRVSAPSLLVHPHFFIIRIFVQHNGERQQ